MERDERRRADALDRFWDARQRGDSPTRPDELDEMTAQLVDHLSRRPASPDMTAAQLRVRQRIVAAVKTMEETMHVTALPLSGTGSITRPPDGRSGRVARHHHGRVPNLALAAMLLLALVAGLVALDPDLRRPDRGAVIPAAVLQEASPSPTGVLDQETLVEVTLPADVLPLETTTEVGLFISAVPADAGGCCPAQPAQNVTYVLEGTSTFRAQAPAYVIRAGGGATPEVVAAGTEVSLTPGDTILYRDEFGWEWTVTGDGPMRLLSLWMIEGSSLPSSDLASWEVEDYGFITTNALPAAALTLTLRDVTVDAGVTLPPGSAVVQVVVALPAENARLSQGSDYGVKNVGKEPVRLYVASLSPADPDAEIVVAGVAATPAASPVP